MNTQDTITTPRKIASIHINGRRWFQKTYGNTYHSVTVDVQLADGTTKTMRSGKVYGYGEQYIQTAIGLMQAKGLLPDTDDGYWPLSLWCRDNGIHYVNHVADVARKCNL